MNRLEQQQRFDAWLERHAAVLHHIAAGFAEGADRNDLVQELMLALWKAVPAFRGDCQVSTFVYRVAYNAALTWKRSVSTHRRHEDAWVEETGRSGVVIEEGSGARNREMLVLVYAEIRQFPPLDRSLILLHLDDVSYSEIAAILGLTETNVGARLTRIKQRLIANLQEKTHELR